MIEVQTYQGEFDFVGIAFWQRIFTSSWFKLTVDGSGLVYIRNLIVNQELF